MKKPLLLAAALVFFQAAAPAQESAPKRAQDLSQADRDKACNLSSRPATPSSHR
ncbi:MAG TPA: hypothetical protein VL991_05865 [Terracidiphilus sp.]|nr:hypothetical protein [Terracidiphilus sp.]